MAGLKEQIGKNLNIADVRRVEYFDTRYYKVMYKQKGTEYVEHLTSVTEILGGAFPKDFLQRWRGDVGNERADQIIMEALKLGSFVHYGAEVISRKGAVVYNPYQNPIYTPDEIDAMEKKYGEVCVCRFQKEWIQLYRIWQFFDLVKPTQIQTEQTVYSLRHKYAGTLDMIAHIEGGEYAIAGSNPVQLETGLYIFDYKTGKGVDHSYKLQLSAYLEAIKEGIPDILPELKGGLILHTNNEQVKNGIEGFKAHVVTIKEQKEYFQQFLKVYDVYKIVNPIPSPKEFEMPTVLSYVPKSNKQNKKKK
jgi:hypothetical protein